MKAFDGSNIRNGGPQHGFWGHWLTVVACICCVGVSPISAAGEVASATVRPPMPPPHPESRLDQRVALLSKELNLDVQQQAEVRRILADQSIQVMKVWNDPAVPSAERVVATRAISDRTGDRIRALLHEEQKAKYNAPRKPREAKDDSASLSVEDWMKTTNPK